MNIAARTTGTGNSDIFLYSSTIMAQISNRKFLIKKIKKPQESVFVAQSQSHNRKAFSFLKVCFLLS